jgi:hypothetical protein
MMILVNINTINKANDIPKPFHFLEFGIGLPINNAITNISGTINISKRKN